MSKMTIAGKTWDTSREPKYRSAFLESLTRIGTAPMKAIRLYCYQCSGYSHAEVRACECRDCPLFVLKMEQEQAQSRTEKP